MDAKDIRLRFAQFVGKERYRKFLRTLNTVSRQRGRLLFWQEHDWASFVKQHPDCGSETQVPFDAFRVCDVHDCEFQQDLVPIHYGYWNEEPEYRIAQSTEFPFARYVVHIDDCFQTEETNAVVDYCRQCRDMHDKWHKSHEK